MLEKDVPLLRVVRGISWQRRSEVCTVGERVEKDVER